MPAATVSQSLTRTAAAKTALTHRLFRYKDLRRLTEKASQAPLQRSLLDVHESIRPMADYRLENL